MAAAPEELVDELVAGGSVPGAALVVVLATAWSRTLGRHRRPRRLTPVAGHAFALASLTKPLVALAALVAVEEGLVDLDEAVASTCPARRRS